MSIANRRRYGHFEGDTVGRARHTSPETLIVLRERKSRYLLGKKVRRLALSMDGFKEKLHGVPALSATFDNGVENVRHEELGIPTYFCHPYSSWEKGGVENGIRLIREYIPKGSDLADWSDEEIDAIIERINTTPMKCLKYQTPQEVYMSKFLSTACSLDGSLRAFVLDAV
jgi:IS30 family transposase